MDPVAEAALEAVAVEQRHEELEVLFLAVVRRRRHQQEVPRERREELAEFVALGVLDLAAKDRGRHLVRLIADDEIPTAVRRLELLLHVLVARQLVEPGDDQVGFQEPVAGARRFELVVGENLEGQVETAVELILPLFGQAARADDEAALQVAASDQFLDQQAGHDGLAGAGVVGQQETQRLPRQHGLVHGRDLVGQRIDHRRVHRQHRIEEVRQSDALRLGDQAEERAVAVEAPGPALLDDFDARLVVAIEQFVRHLAGRRLVGEFERLGAEPLHADHRDQGIRQDAAQRSVGLKLFELAHAGGSHQFNEVLHLAQLHTTSRQPMPRPLRQSSRLWLHLSNGGGGVQGCRAPDALIVHDNRPDKMIHVILW